MPWLGTHYTLGLYIRVDVISYVRSYIIYMHDIRYHRQLRNWHDSGAVGGGATTGYNNNNIPNGNIVKSGGVLKSSAGTENPSQPKSNDTTITLENKYSLFLF
jgi:hypothetical protein